MEKSLIAAALESKEAYALFSTVIAPSLLSEIGRICYEQIGRYYSADESAESCDAQIIQAALVQKYTKSKVEIVRYLESLPNSPSQENIRRLAVQIKRQTIGEEIMGSLSRGDETRSQELMNDYIDMDESVAESSLYCGGPLDSFYGTVSNKRIPLFPLSLNRRLGGGVPRQSQIGICARPNVGKTTWLCNYAATLARNRFKVLYITNEDPGRYIAHRLIARLSGATRDEVEASEEQYRVLALETGYGNIALAELEPGDIPQIRALLSESRPDVFIIDQLYPIVVQHDSGPTLGLAQITSQTRKLAREFDCVSVVCTQQDKASAGRLILRQEDAEWSSTGFAAQLDLMIGLAQNEQMERFQRVMQSFPRWKYGPHLPHYEVKFNYAQQRVTG